MTAHFSFSARNHPSYWAFIAHRGSGILLALFLPFHFWALSQAIRGAAGLQGFLAWADQPLVKFGEAGLVALLALHFAGGLRLLALEFLLWRAWQKTAVALAAGLAFAVGFLYLIAVF